MADRDHFYLETVFPETDKLFSFEFEELEKAAKDAIYVLDTNVLFVPFDATEKSASEINSILKDLKNKGRLFIPARVAREFANNRARKLGDLFLKIRQTRENLNSGPYKIDDYPLLEGNESFKKVKVLFKEISELLKQSRQELDAIESQIKNWNWDDAVSKMYKEIFTTDTIIEVKKPKEDIIKDLQFRIEHKVAPGYKDSAKIDDGIGDLIVWTTTLEIAKNKNSNVVFVSNDQKSDWFYKQDKIGLYPKFELIDEFRRFTDGKTIHIINFPKFLELQNAKEETVIEIRETIERAIILEDFTRNYTHSDLIEGLHVEHKRFGVGTISRLYLSASSKEWVEIQFESGLTKHFILKFCDLRIIESYYNYLVKDENFDGDERSRQSLDEGSIYVA